MLRNSCTYTRFGWKWGSGQPSRRLVWRSGYMLPTRARTHTHTHKHTHSYTKHPLGQFPVSSLWQTINTKKENAFMSQTPSPCCTNIWTTAHEQVCIFIPPHQHICMYGFLPCFRLNSILSRSNPNLFEHVHLEWTYSLVPSRVYSTSGVDSDDQ